MKKAFFTIDTIIPPTEGYYDPNITWNGWLNPYFTPENVKKICKVLPKEEIGDYYKWENEKLIYEYYENNLLIETEEISGINIDGVTHYPIGYNSWTWEIL